MHQDVVDLNAFYLTRLGRVARRILGQQVRRVWPSVREEVVLGLGYPVPYLGLFRAEAERVFAVMPAGQGVMAWPESGGRLVALADDGVLPLPDGSIDRILIVHGLEFSEQRRPMLEEVWRVMRPNGRILVLVPNRHGLWARAEATPFGHGSPFSASQLARLLREHRFAPLASGAMLFLPPTGWRAVLRTAAVWQRLGRHLGRPFGGIVYVEAGKTVLEAVPVAARRRRRVIVPLPAPVPAGARTLLFSLSRRALGLYSFPSGAGRSLRSLGLRALRRAGAVAPAGPLRGPVPLGSHALGRAGAPARRPGRCAARSRSSPAGAAGARTAGSTLSAPPGS